MEDRLDPRARRDDALALGSLAFIGLVTAVWWAVALWPLDGDAPVWLVRTRLACFGAAPDGLPDAGGWILLIGQPLSMLAFLAIVWGRAVRGALVRCAAGRLGRFGLAGAAGAILLGVGAAGTRVHEAAGAQPAFVEPLDPPPPTYPRIDRPAPSFALVDQRGDTITMERFRGRTVLVTFAFAHCADVCPVILREVLAAQAALAQARPVVLVFTLDPWRDTPPRLPAIAAGWQLGADGHLLGGDVERVGAALDAWQVPRRRDPDTGAVVHPALAYIVDAEGRIVYATTGGEATIVELARRL